MTCVLTLLMRLRQACVHLALINQVLIIHFGSREKSARVVYLK